MTVAAGIKVVRLLAPSIVVEASQAVVVVVAAAVTLSLALLQMITAALRPVKGAKTPAHRISAQSSAPPNVCVTWEMRLLLALLADAVFLIPACSGKQQYSSFTHALRCLQKFANAVRSGFHA